MRGGAAKKRLPRLRVASKRTPHDRLIAPFHVAAPEFKEPERRPFDEDDDQQHRASDNRRLEQQEREACERIQYGSHGNDCTIAKPTRSTVPLFESHWCSQMVLRMVRDRSVIRRPAGTVVALRLRGPTRSLVRF